MSRQYWLFKSEPGCYSVDDLAAQPDQTDHWDGVRNYQARNYLRDEIKRGDGVFFYHSSCQPAGIVGICKVVRDSYPDHTALAPEADHFDPKATRDAPIWFMIDLKLVRKLPDMITLAQLKATPGLEGMAVCQRGSRLSIQPVSTSEWDVIMMLAKEA
ncbi:MAG: EVE domain-containing protein [Candidatus Zixiibacteriota bacterium]